LDTLVGGANDGTGGDETGGEANSKELVADQGRDEADGSEDCGALHYGARTPNMAMCAAS